MSRSKKRWRALADADLEIVVGGTGGNLAVAAAQNGLLGSAIGRFGPIGIHEVPTREVEPVETDPPTARVPFREVDVYDDEEPPTVRQVRTAIEWP